MKTKIEKPLLSGKAPEDLGAINFPVLASPKLDGIRCLMIGGKALTRTFKPIPNDFIREWLEAHVPDGFDGELMPRGDMPFKDFSGAVRRKTGEPDFVFMAFDYIDVPNGEGLETAFRFRYESMKDAIVCHELHERVSAVVHRMIGNVDELLAYHADNLSIGYEGTMVRDPNGPYKCGRSSTKQGILLKVKNFADEEAEVIGIEELMHNDNAAEKDAFGRTKRSSHKENLRPAGTMGKLRMRMLSDGTEFSCGTGFTAEERLDLWTRRDEIVGQVATVKHQPDPGGRQEGQAPRFPVFVAWRPDGI